MHNGIHYEPILVMLSYVISVLGSYTALQLAIAIPQARDRLAALGLDRRRGNGAGRRCHLVDALHRHERGRHGNAGVL